MTVPSETDSPSAGIETTVPLVCEVVCELVCVGAGAIGAAATGAGVGAGVGAAATGAGAGALAPSAIKAKSAPTGTVASTATRIFSNVPAAGDGISVSTLSVDTSRSGSSSAT